MKRKYPTKSVFSKNQSVQFNFLFEFSLSILSHTIRTSGQSSAPKRSNQAPKAIKSMSRTFPVFLLFFPFSSTFLCPIAWGSFFRPFCVFRQTARTRMEYSGIQFLRLRLGIRFVVIKKLQNSQGSPMKKCIFKLTFKMGNPSFVLCNSIKNAEANGGFLPS